MSLISTTKSSPLAVSSASPFRSEEWRNLVLASGAPGRRSDQRHYFSRLLDATSGEITPHLLVTPAETRDLRIDTIDRAGRDKQKFDETVEVIK